jgi:hypothetical protein
MEQSSLEVHQFSLSLIKMFHARRHAMSLTGQHIIACLSEVGGLVSWHLAGRVLFNDGFRVSHCVELNSTTATE